MSRTFSTRPLSSRSLLSTWESCFSKRRILGSDWWSDYGNRHKEISAAAPTRDGHALTLQTKDCPRLRTDWHLAIC
jgi:hypothetical protein